MRTVGIVAFACLIPLAGSGQTTHKKHSSTSAAKPTGRKKSTAKAGSITHSKSRTARNRTTSKHRRGSRAKSASWRTRQLAPNPERYKEIQQALAAKGYLNAAPSGVWDNESADALRRFQRDQNLEPTGKLNSMSLIALGLGPKRESGPAVPSAPKAVEPPQNPTPPAVPEGSTPPGTAAQPPASLTAPAANAASTPSTNPPKPQP